MVDRADDDIAASGEGSGDEQDAREMARRATMGRREAAPHRRYRNAAAQWPPPPQPEPSASFDGFTWQEWSTGPMTMSPQAERAAMMNMKARFRIFPL
jgi:hypothetical protein